MHVYWNPLCSIANIWVIDLDLHVTRKYRGFIRKADRVLSYNIIVVPRRH
jgi:hypothetical protein